MNRGIGEKKTMEHASSIRILFLGSWGGWMGGFSSKLGIERMDEPGSQLGIFA